MRIFIGIKLDNKTTKIINNYYKYLYSENITGNYTDSNNLHLTLAFLGEIDQNTLENVITITNSLENKITTITLSKITKLKDMLVFEVAKDDKLLALQKELALKLENINIYKSKEFYPHVTLIRKVSDTTKINIVDKEVNICSSCDNITVFQSTHINGKLKYIPCN